jgi:hypothetical protein
VLAREQDKSAKDRFSLRIWRRVCGGSSSSDSGGGTGGGGVPSVGTKKVPSVEFSKQMKQKTENNKIGEHN